MQLSTNRSKKRPLTAQKPEELSPVAALAKRARALDALDRKLRQPLPEPLRRHCCLADVRAGRIVFLASSSVWAAKLRSHQNAIMTEASVITGLKIEKFAVKVAPLPLVPPRQTKIKPLSRAAADHLEAAARSLSDPDLRALYLRMASLADRSSS
ncbi:MAG TPA: DciA family protein [Rudaea sp.]